MKMIKYNFPGWAFFSAIFLSLIFLSMARYSINDYKAVTPAVVDASSGDIKFNIDYCTIQPRFSLIQGWVGLSDGGIDVEKNIYRIDQEGRAHKLHYTTVRTPQIVNEYKNPAFSHAGFIASAKNDSKLLMTNKFAIELNHNGKKNVVTYACK